MYVVVSWDIPAAGERWQKIDEMLRQALAPFRYLRPLSTFFVVTINSAEDRQQIINGLQTRAGATAERIELLVSPVIPTGARFAGRLIPSKWTEVNNLTG